MAGLLWVLFLALGFIALTALIASARRSRPLFSALFEALEAPPPVTNLRLTVREMGLAHNAISRKSTGRRPKSRRAIYGMNRRQPRMQLKIS